MRKMISSSLTDTDGDDGKIAIHFAAENPFGVDSSASPLITYSGGDNGGESLDLSPFGQCRLEWQIIVKMTDTGLEFVNGSFQWTIPEEAGEEADTLVGKYTGFNLDMATGKYVLLWSFDGGTGKFENTTGEGRTDGQANLGTGYAVYEFHGLLSLNDDGC